MCIHPIVPKLLFQNVHLKWLCNWEEKHFTKGLTAYTVNKNKTIEHFKDNLHNDIINGITEGHSYDIMHVGMSHTVWYKM